MQTEQELEDEKKAIERDAQLEAQKPWLARTSDRYWQWRERNTLSFAAGLVLFTIAGIVAIVAKACNMH